jgi:hypothetical protein
LQTGDFGLGTLNDLDGEVVILGGVAYQQSADGLTQVLDPSEKTPYMTTTFLEMSTHKPTNIDDLRSGNHGPMVSTACVILMWEVCFVICQKAILSLHFLGHCSHGGEPYSHIIVLHAWEY